MTIKTESLRNALQMVAPVFKSKTTVAATEHVLISGGYVSGTDLTTSIRAKVEMEGDEQIVVRYEEILKTAEACRNGEITLEIIPTGEALMCHFKSGRRRGKFPAMELSEMVSMDFSAPEQTFKMKSIDVYQHAKAAAEFTAKDDIARPSFEYIHFISEAGAIHVVATDAASMYFGKPHVDVPTEVECDVWVKKNTVAILKEMTGFVDLGVTDEYNYISSEECCVKIRKIDAKFLTVEQLRSVFAYKPEFKQEINLKEFLNDVGDASLFSTKGTSLVVFDEGKVYSEDLDYNRGIDVKTDLNMPKSGFSARNILKTPEIDIKAEVMMSPTRPMLIKYSDVVIIVMPIVL